MDLGRRQLLAAGGACLVSCASGARPKGSHEPRALDTLLEAHADKLPERAGAGANHYPMAAEALEAMGREDAIDAAWSLEGAALYAGEAGRVGPIESDADVGRALGSYARFGDWLDCFRAALLREPWRDVLAAWSPRLAPALGAAAFHGVIRTGHAARALRRRETRARRDELAVGLAYWASRYVELPVAPRARGEEDLRVTLTGLEHPWIDDHDDVDFFAVGERLTARPLAPTVDLAPLADPRAELDRIVREAATAFLEMLVLERNRVWLLHTVTGPGAVEWLLPDVDERGARLLVAHARQAVVAMYAAYGEPYTPGAHVRARPAPWPALTGRAAASGSVHGIKLIDALERFDRDGDPLWRSVAEQWFEWT